MPQTIKKSIPGLNLTYSASKKQGNQRCVALSETIKLFFEQKGLSFYQFEITNEQQLVGNEDLQPIVKVSKKLDDGETLSIGTMAFTFSEDETVANVNVDCSNHILVAIVEQCYNSTVLTEIEKDTHFLTFADSLERLNVALEGLLPSTARSAAISTSSSSSFSPSVSPPVATKKLFAWGGFFKRIIEQPDDQLNSQQEVIGIINQILPDLQNIPDSWGRRQNVSDFAVGLDSFSLESAPQYRGMTDLELTNRAKVANKITEILEKYQRNQQPTPADINELRGAIDKLEGAGSEVGRKRYAGIMAVSSGFFFTGLTLYILTFSVLVALVASPATLLPIVLAFVGGGAALIYSGLAYRGNKPSFMPAVLYHIADKMEALMSPEVGNRPGSLAQRVEGKSEHDLGSRPVYGAAPPTTTASSDSQAQKQGKGAVPTEEKKM